MERSPDRVHYTNLKRFSDSAAHYLASLEEESDSPAMRFGRLVHFLVLGGKGWVVWEEGDRRGKKWDAFAAEHAGLDIFTRKEVDHASLIAASVRLNSEAAPLLAGEHELLVDWDNDGVPFRSHLDGLGVGQNGRRHLIDLKTTTSSNPLKFHWEARRLAYHAQLATYMRAAKYIGKPVDDAYLIAVEKEAPYAVTVFQLTPALLLEGEKLAASWLERYKVCSSANAWPAYAQAVVTMDVLPTSAEEPVELIMADGSSLVAA